MKIFCKFPTVNISKLIFWLVICIAKNFIWTTVKMIFSIFWIFCTLGFQIFKYCPIITNHTSMENVFSFRVMYKYQFRKIDAYDWFCGPGSHIQYNTLYYSMVQKHYSIFAWTFAPWDERSMHTCPRQSKRITSWKCGLEGLWCESEDLHYLVQVCFIRVGAELSRKVALLKIIKQKEMMLYLLKSSIRDLRL